MDFFLDVNILFSCLFENHPRHKTSKDWIKQSRAKSFCASRAVQNGVLRLLTSRQICGEKAISNAEAIDLWKVFAASISLRIVPETGDIENRWFEYATTPSASPMLWNDALIAAFAASLNATLVTYDKGFTRYPGVKIEIIS